MRKILLTTVILLLSAGLTAQSLQDIIGQNIRCSAGSDMAYPGSTQLHLSPAPEGYKPFYISHFGRHGSCYLEYPESYDIPYRILEIADSLGKLTSLGHDVLLRLDRIRHDAYERWGELSELGAHQQQQIMRRMVNRFPEVFVDGATIDARSTTRTLSILSMEYAMAQLVMMRPKVKIHHNATQRDMSYLNHHDKHLLDRQSDSTMLAAFAAFAQKCRSNSRLTDELFNDDAYVSSHVDADKLNDYLFRVASNIQNTELRKRLTLYDIFSDEDVCCNWEKQNARTYCTYGSYPHTAAPPYSRTQCQLLRKMIVQADSCIRLQKPGAHLRYGFEQVLLPLICLLDINGSGMVISDFDAVDRKGWADFKLCPMSANIQFIFYASPSRRADDILVKVLLNEVEVKLPVRSMLLPYYHWRDVRDYYLQKVKVNSEK